MAVEHIHQVKRTLYVSTCPKCSDRVEKDDNPPRERLCQTCNEWAPFVEVSYTGPDIKRK